jgi:hypothetical protein
MMTGRIFVDIVTSRQPRAHEHRAHNEPRLAFPAKDRATHDQVAKRLAAFPRATFPIPRSMARNRYAYDVNYA